MTVKRREADVLASLPPLTAHARFCEEAGPPPMVWDQQIAPGMPVLGRCRRCGAIAKRVVRR